MYCKKCGMQNPDGARFCTKCGEPLAAETAMCNQTVNVNVYSPSAAAPSTATPSTAPVGQLKTNKGLLKYILLSFFTFGIYGIVALSSVSNNINIVASRYDGKHTMHFCLLFFLVGPLTFGIGTLVWFHNISARIGSELRRRGVAYTFDASTFWIWDILGALIIIGPLVYLYKLFKATNLVCKHYNEFG